MSKKYNDDKYDREKYIPKGYILSDGTMLTKQYARLHEDMAERFVMENYRDSFMNDVIKDKKDYMLMRLGALQVLSSGKPIILFCDKNQTNIIREAIVSYLSYGWQEIIIANPYCSVNDYLRSRLLKETGLIYKEDKYEKETNKSKILTRCR